MYPLRRPLPPKPSPQRASWGNSPNYKEIWQNSLKKHEGRTPPRRAHASLPPRRHRASPPMSPLLGASCSLYDEFYPWHGDAVKDYWEAILLGEYLDEETDVDFVWRDGFEAGMNLALYDLIVLCIHIKL